MLAGGLPGGAVLTVLVLLGGSVPASAQALTWSVVPSPDQGTSRNILQGVSCASAALCTAVGHYYTSSRVLRGLIESWDGIHWSLVASPSPANNPVLNGISCVSAAACTAAGFRFSSGAYRTLIESGTASGQAQGHQAVRPAVRR